MWEVIYFYINGDCNVFAKNLDEETANKYANKLNKKCDWTQYYLARQSD